MQEVNPKAKAAILEVVENQIRDNTPPETRETYNRLLKQGYSDEEARELIGAIVSSQIYEVLKHQRPYDQSSYIKALRQLPELPWE
jgi:hypothetical protein